MSVHASTNLQSYGNDGFSLLQHYADKVSSTVIGMTNKKAKSIAMFAIDIFKKWQKRRLNKFTLKDQGLEVFKSMYRECALLLVQTMVYAFRADGKIQNDEIRSMHEFYKQILGRDDVRGIIDAMLTKNLDPHELKMQLKYSEEALDVYMLSAYILDKENFMDANYLENLAASLRIEPSLQRTLDDNVRSIKAMAV